MNPSLRSGVLSGMALVVPLTLFWMDLGCTGSELTNTWMNPYFTGPPLTSMLVIAVKRNPVSRRIWEDGLVADLAAHKVVATPSYVLYPDDVPDTNQVAAAFQDRHYDGVLIIRRLPTQRTVYDSPGYVRKEAVTRYNRLKDAYFTIYRDVYEPGRSDTLKVMRHEMEVWSTGEGAQMIWAGTGESLDPTSRDAVRQQITGIVVPELAGQGIIPKE